MEPIISLILYKKYVDPIQGIASWLGLVFLVALLVLTAWKTRDLNKKFTSREFWLFLGLLVLLLLGNLFLGVKLPAGSALPQPQMPEEPLRPIIMFFSAIPYVLAGGIFGPAAAAVLGIISGLIRSIFLTHSYLSLFQTTFLALSIGIGLRQIYRTKIFHLLRQPLFLIFPATVLFSVLHILITPLTISGTLVNRVDYALSTLPGFTLARFIELIIAGLVGEAVRLALPKVWVRNDNLLPSPAEKSLQARFLIYLSPLALTLILTLMTGAWYQAGRSAQSMLRSRLANTAQVAADQIPLLMTAGQQLFVNISQDTRLGSENKDIVQAALAEDIKILPYFSQLILIDRQGEIIGLYPAEPALLPEITPEENFGIQLTLTSEAWLYPTTIKPLEGQTAAQIALVAPIVINGQRERVLIGRSRLAENPFSKSIIASLKELDGEDGFSMILDEDKHILVHPDPNQVMKIYQGPVSQEPELFNDISPTGTRQYTYYQPVDGHSWSLALVVPAARTQQIAVEMAAPLLVMIILLSIVAIFITRMGLGVVTTSLQSLAEQAGRLAQGNLEQPLIIDGQDEIGMLRKAFEKMRQSLKARLDELNRLLIVSQGVASSLDMAEAIQPILEAALVTGANLARVVVMPEVVPDIEGSSSEPISFSHGPAKGAYHELDNQMLTLTRQLNRLVLSNVYRPRLLNFEGGRPHPESVLAIALQHENKDFGALWIGYDLPHSFTEEEVRFLSTLASQASLAASNARLFLNAEIGRQRLAAILASSPDPILVIDQRDYLLLSNPAAWLVLGMNMENSVGLPLQKAVHLAELIELLQSPSAERQSKEITLADQRVFLATATAVMAEGQRMGRVCVLRDITHFKQLDSLKTDFVATVSHDLRSPLTLMRGYATMLDGLGHLNEQQADYVKKIVTAVQDMTHLVNNLLDLGRIDAGVGLQLEMVSAPDILDQVSSQLKPQAAQKRIQLGTVLPPQPLPLIDVDKALLLQALQNLVENSIKFTRVEGKVQLRANIQNAEMVFEVEDNGSGISPMDLPRLFERFYRGAQPQGKDQRGTGLGLAIVKSIAEKHGGQVWAESQLGKGSVFYLSIPLRQPVSQQES